MLSRRNQILTPPKNILVADTDARRCLSLASIVKRLDYNVFLATDVPALIRITSGIIPHVVLLDLDMPQIEGKPCMNALKANRGLELMKIIMVADAGRTTDLVAAVYKGAGAYVTRPVSPTELYRTIQKQIEPSPRQFLRIKVLFKATVITGKTGRVSFATALSEQGAFIRTLKPLPVGARFKVSIELPTPKPLVLDGEVLYILNQEPDRHLDPGMGIRFVGMDSDTQAGLRSFIEEQVMGEGWEGLL